MDDCLKVGIIGCGVIAPSHIDSYLALGGVRVTALCDPRGDRMEAIRGRYPDLGASEFGSLTELLRKGEVDVLSICTDHASHEDLVGEALRAGKHVLCEKPLTTNLDSLGRLLELEKGTDLVTSGILQHRFDPVYRELKKALASGELGMLLNASCQHQCRRTDDYYRADGWRGTWKGEGGSLLINQSIHFLDILQWLCGGVRKTRAFAANLCHRESIETEDSATLALEFAGGALGSFIATSGSHRQWESAFQFTGSEGTVLLRNGKLDSVSHLDSRQEEALRERLGNLLEPEPVPGAKAYYGTSHPAQIRDFIESVRHGRRPFVSFADAGEVLAVVLEAYRSAGLAVADGAVR